MIVIQSGFESVKALALAPNSVAVRNAERPLVADVMDRVDCDAQLIERESILWDVELWSLPPEGQPQRYADANDNPFGLEFEPITGCLLYGECSIGVKRAGSGAVVRAESGGGIIGFAISPDGARLLCLESWRDMATFETRPPECRFLLFTRTADLEWGNQQVIRYDGEPLGLPAFFPDGERFVASGRVFRFDRAHAREYPVPVQRVFDARTFALLDTVETCQRNEPPCFCGQWMATFNCRAVVFHDTSDFTQPPVLVPRGKRDFTALAAAPDGRFFLTASGSSVSVWDPKSWKIAKTFDWKAGAITCLAVAPDGLTAAAGTATGKVVVWDVE